MRKLNATVILLTIILLYPFRILEAQNVKESEETALNGLLSILEAQTRFAVRHKRYAMSISELGYQSSVADAGQITMKSAFLADYDSTEKQAAEGYYFRILPIKGTSENERNSFWAVAIPESKATNLPLYFTAAYHVKNISFPLVNWWAIRVHGKNRTSISKIFATEQAVSVEKLGFHVENLSGISYSTVINRFSLDSRVSYPPAEPNPPEIEKTHLYARTATLISIALFVLVIIIMKLKQKRK